MIAAGGAGDSINEVEQAFFEPIPVVLTASRLAQPVDETPAAITVIDREVIEASGFNNIADVLRLVPGFQVAMSTLEHLRANPYDGTRLIVYGGYLRSGSEDGPAGDFNSQILRTAGRLLRSDLGKELNDGFVPLDSALFAGNPNVAARRVFAGYDHEDITGYRLRSEEVPEQRSALIDSIVQDIVAAYGLTLTSTAVPTLP